MFQGILAVLVATSGISLQLLDTFSLLLKLLVIRSFLLDQAGHGGSGDLELRTGCHCDYLCEGSDVSEVSSPGLV